MILIEKLQKYQPLSSEKINKHEYLTRGEILSSNQKKKKVEQVKFTYSSLEKSFEKQTKITEDHVKVSKSLESSEKRLASIKDYISKERLHPEIAYEKERIEKEERKLIEAKCFTKDIIKPMISENSKQYLFLVIISKIILLLRVWKMMNKIIWQIILDILKISIPKLLTYKG